MQLKRHFTFILIMPTYNKSNKKVKNIDRSCYQYKINGVIHYDIVRTEEITDKEGLYVIFNIKKEKYQPRYKFMHNEKVLYRTSFTSNSQQLPFNLVYSFDDPEDQVLIFKKLVADCINTHAPLRKVKLTRPVAP